MIAGTGMLVAVEIVLQIISYLIPTAVNMNLGLIPIVLGAILYGPVVGGFIGLVNGVIILVSPNTVSLFMGINPTATVFTCLLKTSIAGVIAGFVAHFLKEKHSILGAILASIIVPVVNTGIFVMFCYFFFKEGLGLPTFASIFTAFIGINFLFEVISTLVIGPSLTKILESVKKN